MIRAGLCALALTAGLPAAAQPIVIEAAEGFVLVRCLDMFGTAACEFLVAPGADVLNCVAFDAEGQPLAVAPAFAATGQVMFAELSAGRIDRVICRR